MGYELHLTRAESWSENEGQPISEAEWLAVVDQDPELRIDDANGPYFALWAPPDGSREGWFDWFDGNISTKHPDRRALAKMLSIARLLDAKVQGDEGEEYRAPGNLPADYFEK